MGFVWFFIGIIVLITFAVIYGEKKKTSNLNNTFVQNGIAPTRKLGDFWVDETSKKWAVGYYGGCSKVYNFSDIVDFELVENGNNYKSKGGLTRSIIGGLAFGVAGAVVGATTAKKQTTINQLAINIFVSDISNSLVTINFISSETKTDGFVYQSVLSLAKQTIATLTAIRNECENIPS